MLKEERADRREWGTVNRDRWSAEQVRALRERLHLSQTQLATRLGVSPNSVSNWELGKGRPGHSSGLSLDRMASADDVSADVAALTTLAELLAPLIRDALRQKREGR